MNKQARDTYNGGDLYVIAGSKELCESPPRFPGPGRYPVLPAGGTPATFGSMDQVADALLSLKQEHGYTPETGSLFKLVPVPVGEVEAAMAKARARQVADTVYDLCQDHCGRPVEQAESELICADCPARQHLSAKQLSCARTYLAEKWAAMRNSTQRTVALVGCSARKLERPAPARGLYTGVLFQYARTWVTGNGWPWHVLSAEHGLVDPDQVLEPYDTRFRQSAPSEWVDEVWQSLLERYDGLTVHFKLLAGLPYRVQLMRRIQDHLGWTAEAPLAGLGIGQQIAWLRERAAKARRYPGAPPACPECGDVSQATKTYNAVGLAVCLNCNSAFEPPLIGQWVLGDVSSYNVEKQGGGWVTVRASSMDHAEKLVCAMGLTPVCIQEAEDDV